MAQWGRFSCLSRLLSSSGGVGGGGGGGPASHYCFSAARSYRHNPYALKVGIAEFLRGIGGGVEGHVAKLEAEIGDIQKLLETRTLRLKKLGIPCKHRKLILNYAHKYRLGLWRPRAEPQKA